MKKISRILSMVIVVGMIAAIPASTQILSGAGGESSDGANLPMLILVNRLELSGEQMQALQGLLTDLLDEKETIDALRAEFEDVMIRFNGTGEELDELLVTFREDQQASAAALHESVEASLDEIRDLLSINQGIALREALPRLLGGGILPGSDHGVNRLQNVSGMMGNRMPVGPMGRADMIEQIQQARRGGRSPMQGNTWMDSRSESFDQESHRFGDDSMASMMQGRFGSDNMRQMPGEWFGQGGDDSGIGTMLERLQDRFKQFGDQIPEELRERLESYFRHGQFNDRQDSEEACDHSDEHCDRAVENQGEHQDRSFGGVLGHLDNQAGTAMLGQGVMGRLGERGDLFELLEQLTEVLQLKLGAME